MNKFNEVLKKSIEDTIYYEPEKSIESIMKTVFETILNLERSEYLTEQNNSENKANGYYTRLLKSINQYFKLSIPRDRLSLFKPVFLDVLNQQEAQRQELAFKLYVKGLTTRDIEDVFKEIFNQKMSPTTVSNITGKFQETREAWLNRPISSEYYFIYIDALMINVKRDTVEKEAFYIVLGLKPDLKREVLGVYNIPVESSTGWRTVLKDLKKRGLRKTLMVIADGLSSLEKVVSEELPEAKMQKCLVHKIGSLINRVRTGDKTAIKDDFHNVFRLEDPEYTTKQGIANLDKFILKWSKKYPFIKNKFTKEHYLNYFAYLNFPYPIHRMIYTTNWIERLNKSIRRTVTMRNSFPSPDSALNLICAYMMDFEEKTYKHPVTSFLKVKDTLDCMLFDLVCPQTHSS